MKKSVSVILIIVLCLSLFSIPNASAAEIEPQIEEDVIQGVLERSEEHTSELQSQR